MRIDALVRAAVAWAVISAGGLARAQVQPGPEHKLLESEAGTWDATMKFWMGPDAPPEEAQGVETNTMLGGLWLVSDFKGEFGGQPFLGHGQNGYDVAKQKYVGTWIDSMSPSIMSMEGTYDPAAKSLTMTGKMFDQMAGKEVDVRTVTVHKSADQRVFTMYVPGPSGEKGKDVKMMEITYIRRK